MVTKATTAAKKIEPKKINTAIDTFDKVESVTDTRTRDEIMACHGALINNGVPTEVLAVWPMDTIVYSGKALLQAKIASSVAVQAETHKQTEKKFAKSLQPFFTDNAERIFNLSGISDDPKPSKTVKLLSEKTADGNMLTVTGIVLNDKPNNPKRKTDLDRKLKFQEEAMKLASSFGLKPLIDWLRFQRGTKDAKSQGIGIKTIKYTAPDGQTYSIKASIGIRPLTDKELAE